jgi:hypothetical protein
MSDSQLQPYTYPPESGAYEPPQTFQPTEEQLARVKGLRRFNFWTVYLPLGLVAAGVVGLTVYMLILAIWPPYEGTRPFLSGLADSVLILVLLPQVLLCGLVQAGILAGFYYWRQNRKEAIGNEPNLRYGRLRLFLWRLQSWLALGMEKLNPVLNIIADQVIKLNAGIAALTDQWGRLRRQKD